MIAKILPLVLGGATGTLARYAFSGAVHQVFGTGFPYGTMVVNMFGCFLIGFLASIGSERLLLGMQTQLLLTVGFCGAFTTFSTFMFETAHLIKAGNSMHAFMNVLLSVIVGFLIFKLGVMLAEVF